MTRIACLLGAVVALGWLVAYVAAASGRDDEKVVPVFGIKILPGYRDWSVISVAHEEGNLNDLRAVLGNNVAIKAYRDGKTSFPDGTVIARLSWKYEASEENNKVFGRAQSFVAGAPTDWYLQFMVKDSKKYAATGGWGVACDSLRREQSGVSSLLRQSIGQGNLYRCHRSTKQAEPRGSG